MDWLHRFQVVRIRIEDALPLPAHVTLIMNESLTSLSIIV